MYKCWKWFIIANYCLKIVSKEKESDNDLVTFFNFDNITGQYQ